MIHNGISSLSIKHLSLQMIHDFTMSPVTEIATLFLKAGTDIEDQSSPTSKIAQEAFSTISSQPGFQRIYYGPELEDASLLQLFIGVCPQDSQRMHLLPSTIAPRSFSSPRVCVY
jgi:hypothetical protein